jgi:hypothetical protein
MALSAESLARGRESHAIRKAAKAAWETYQATNRTWELATEAKDIAYRNAQNAQKDLDRLEQRGDNPHE